MVPVVPILKHIRVIPYENEVVVVFLLNSYGHVEMVSYPNHTIPGQA